MRRRWWTVGWLLSNRLPTIAYSSRELLDLAGECCESGFHSGHPAGRVNLISGRSIIIVSRHIEGPIASGTRAMKGEVNRKVIRRRSG